MVLYGYEDITIGPISFMNNQRGCPLDPVVKLISGEWTVHIIWTLGQEGPSRFGELRRRVDGISSKVLTDRLRMLEDKGLVHRDEEKSVPPAVTYSLSDTGQELHRGLLLFEGIATSIQ